MEVVAVTITAVAVIVVLIEGLPTVGSERLGGWTSVQKAEPDWEPEPEWPPTLL